MKNKILLCMVVILFVVYLSKGSVIEDTSFLDYKLVIKDLSTNKTVDINMEEYLVGVVAGEMPISYEREALKAQAVASRSYALYKSKNRKTDYDLTTDNKTQVYLTNDQLKTKWGSKYDENLKLVNDVINDTKGEIITYNNEVISAYYFSMSNGMTENSKDVFNENKPYLVSVSSLENNSLKNYSREISFSLNTFCSKLSIKDCLKIDIGNITYNDTHHVTSITINNKKYTGIELRKLLGLYSTDFIIKHDNNKIIITCNGHGHDVGMSQYGANLMAKKGYNYIEILKHYYTGVEIEKINV